MGSRATVSSTARVGLEHILSLPALLGGGLLGFVAALVTRRGYPTRTRLRHRSGLPRLRGVGVSLLGSLSPVARHRPVDHAWIRAHRVDRSPGTGEGDLGRPRALLIIAYGITALDDRATGLRLERARVRANAAQVADLHRIVRPGATRLSCMAAVDPRARPPPGLRRSSTTLGRDPGEIEDARHTRAGVPEYAFVMATASAIAGNQLGPFPDLPTAAQRPASFCVVFRDVRWELPAPRARCWRVRDTSAGCSGR